MKAEDATEKEDIIRKTKNYKRRNELFRAKTAKADYEDYDGSCRSTPNGIYHGSVGSDEVFRTNSEQKKWYGKPEWYRWNPNGPKDLNEDEFYQNLYGDLGVPSSAEKDVKSRLTPIINVWKDLCKMVRSQL